MRHWLQNRSFEDAGGWTVVDDAEITDAYGAVSGTKAAALTANGGAGEGSIDSDVFAVTQPFTPTVVQLWFNWSVTSGIPTVDTNAVLQFWIYNRTTAPGVWSSTGLGQQVKGVNRDEWTMFDLSAFAAALQFAEGGGAIRWRFINSDAESTIKRILLDDLVVRPLTGYEVAKWEAVNGLLTQLKAINGGATYHHDLASRVYTRELWPDKDAGITKPFLTVVENPATLEGYETAIDETVRLFVSGFVSDSNPSAVDSDSVEEVAKLHDDIVKALHSWTLPEPVKEFKVLTHSTPPPERGFQACEFEIELHLMYGVGDLGP